MKIRLFVISFLLIVLNANAQEQDSIIAKFKDVPQLTYKEMLTDHDSLVSYFQQASPIIYFNKEVRNIDFWNHAKNLRNQIKENTTMPEYLKLVNKTINSAQDGHSQILGNFHLDIMKDNWFPNKVQLVKGIDSSDVKYGYIYREYLNKRFSTKLDLNLVYTSGEYYNLLPFSYKNKTYPASMKLIDCNNTKIHQFVNSLTELVSPLRWDRVNNRVYSIDFYSPADIYENDTLRLTFLDKANKKHQLNIKKNDTVKFLQKRNLKYGYNSLSEPVTTHYFDKNKIFYAKLPMMKEEYGDTINNRLEKTLKKGGVGAVVIDIRGNPGGSDNTFNKFLKKIIKDTLKVDIAIGRNFSPYNKWFFEINKDSILNNPTYHFKADVATLDNPEMYYIVIPDYTYVTPDSITYPFDGPIYILQDRYIYSSASNLSNLAKRSDRLISIGETPDLLSGLQTGTPILSLPFSKILFRLEPQIDFTNSKTKLDIFQNNVEHHISYSIEFLYERTITKEDVFGKDFLLRKDPMFKKVLDLEKKRKK
ncbi:peptidase S41 [Gillisia limnaea]|uniref:Peptidase S41 n=1 Tax=Gillisia limnaea (strain DSM 15749 / LMG 21470 / R-8282) TaxID=865937 RepID=H2BXE8_GILLR|nr:peptidase S41 [Gillisia limnaea]EHQ02030.1 peptidase S41 [Gillisia limnaea DSM 15749]